MEGDKKMSRIENGDIVKHFKREELTEEQLKENPLMYLYKKLSVWMLNIQKQVRLL